MIVTVPARLIVAAAVLLLLPPVVLAQGGLAGVVRDASGAVVPGVTVEAASPVLIEKVRTSVTDGEGLYKIVDLRPGIYTVTFTLPGFSTVRREGIELSSSFTATVNAEMRVSAVEETITVSGAAPAVDVVNVGAQKVIANDILAALPAARSPQAFIVLTPGIASEKPLATVGSGQAEDAGLTVHGSRVDESLIKFDGDRVAVAVTFGGRGSAVIRTNQAIVQEVSVQTGGNSAEEQMSGVVSNVVPKDGSNTFTGYVYGTYADHNLQADNLTDELKARGLTNVSGIQRLWEFTPAAGGRILRDRLWFYAAARGQSTDLTRAGVYYNLTPLAWTYTPDVSRPATSRVTDHDRNVRLTWQATNRNKLSLFLEAQPHIFYKRGFQTAQPRSPEATHYSPYLPNSLVQATWKSPLTNRLLVQAGFTYHHVDFEQRRQIDPAVPPGTVSAREASTNLIFRAEQPTTGYGHNDNRAYTYRAAAAYITGAHAFKVGVDLRRGSQDQTREADGDVGVTLLNGSPTTLTLTATPYHKSEALDADLGFYAQEQWTLRRITLNLGLRFDYMNASTGAVQIPATQFVPARDFAAVDDVPNWKDVSPRIGAAYDLFGNGKTAIKANVGRYLAGQAMMLAAANNPVTTSVLNVTRAWTDGDRDFVPDCDLANPQTNGECGTISDLNFGQNNSRATRYSEDVLHGFGSRGYNWEALAALEHELTAQVSVHAGYFRRWFGNFTTVDNLQVVPADFDPYCITAPVDPRLPNSGQSICGLYDVQLARFGRVQNVVDQASRFGAQTEVYNGVDLTARARFANGIQLSGGMNVGRSETDRCFVVDSPDQRFCHVAPPFKPAFSVYGVYPLPWWGLRTSATFQNLAGPQILATYVARNAEIAPSLGRNLSAGAGGTVNVELVAPGTLYADRQQQVDVRLSKLVRLGRMRILGSMDIFNLLNSSAIQTLNTQYGPAWQRPLDIQAARYFKFSAQLDF